MPEGPRFRRPGFGWGNRIRVNDRIRAREVRLIGVDGKQIGVVPLAEALRQARVADLDLVEVNATAQPSVCRILDYGKYQYEQDKREREGRKKQKRAEVKGVRITFKMGEHDRGIRRALAERFLKEGNKVRIELVLRGREKALRNFGIQQVETFIRELAHLSTVEEPVGQAPRGLAALIAPTKGS